jgi:hypothetical protein
MEIRGPVSLLHADSRIGMIGDQGAVLSVSRFGHGRFSA